MSIWIQIALFVGKAILDIILSKLKKSATPQKSLKELIADKREELEQKRILKRRKISVGEAPDLVE